jgi:anti-sigma factor RsiW
MTCEQMTQLLDAYCDDELDIATVALVNTHLTGCADCAAECERIRSVQSLNYRGLTENCPADLAAKIRGSISTPAPMTIRPQHPRRWFALAAAAVILIACTVVVPILLNNRQSTDLLAMDVVSAHLRSLQADHLMDVVSTDQHTVKPWFDGKLDFAPPVKDLAAEGFPLVGGRLDYLDGHPAAALIYHRNKHVINLFVWPTKTTAAQSTGLIQGYNVVNWTAGGMQFSAVSDLNAEELSRFGDLVKN